MQTFSPIFTHLLLFPSLLLTEIKLQVLMLQNLLKIFNGYWRMEFPDWGQYKLGVHHQDVKFSFSSVIFPWGDTFMIQRIIFAQEAGFFVLFFNSFVCFNLKPPSWQYLCAVKRNICVFSFFPLDSKNRHFARLQRLLFFGDDIWECRVSSFFEKENISKVWNWWMGARAGSLNQLTSP